METSATIIGLHKPHTDPGTGAPVTFWQLSQYTVNVDTGSISQITVKGFVSQAAAEAGRNPLSFLSFNIGSVPPAGVSHQWLYEQIVAAEGDLQGAVLVHAAAAGASGGSGDA